MTPYPPAKAPWWGQVAILFFVIGVALELTVGRDFIFAGNPGYAAAQAWLLPVLAPFVGIGVLRLERRTKQLESRYPTAWVRLGLMLPLMSLSVAALILVVPLGWSALLGQALGDASAAEIVTVRALDPGSPRGRTCRLKAELAHGERAAHICLDERLSTQLVADPPRVGERLLVHGRRSWFGLHVGLLDRPETPERAP